jgi:Zn finger protein HypA/HybF involved in hydrogenase expression
MHELAITESMVATVAERVGAARVRLQVGSQCGAEIAMGSFLDVCGCGSTDLAVLAGQELRIKHVEVQLQQVEPEVQ